MHFYEEGEQGEQVVKLAFEQQSILNDGFNHHGISKKIQGDPSSEIRYLKSSTYNRINGDFDYVDSDTMIHEFLDVKNGDWVSVKSLTGFRKDGFFFLNAVYKSVPFFVRNTTKLRDFLVNNYRETERKTGDPGYKIILKDLVDSGNFGETDFKIFDRELFMRIRSNF